MPPHSTLTDESLSCHFTCTSPAGTHATFRRWGNPTPTASPAPAWLSDLYGPTLSSSQLLGSLLRFICIFCATSLAPFLLLFPPPDQNQLRTFPVVPFPHLLALTEKSCVASLTQFLIFFPKQQENPISLHPRGVSSSGSQDISFSYSLQLTSEIITKRR